MAVKTEEQMTMEDRRHFSDKVQMTLRQLLVDQENEKLRKQGADFEYVLVYKDESPKQTTG